MSTLTTANSSLYLAVRGLFTVPQKIEGYATDDSFAVDDVQPVQVEMGVDGKLSAGYVPYVTVLTVMLQADSPSVAMFDTWLAAQVANKETFICDGTLSIPSVGSKYALTKGFITEMTPASTGKKILQPRKFTITFEGFTPSPI